MNISQLNDEYDPERGLWVCGRRSFFFFSGAAAIGAAIGARFGSVNGIIFHPDAFVLVWPSISRPYDDQWRARTVIA